MKIVRRQSNVTALTHCYRKVTTALSIIKVSLVLT